MAKSGSNQKLNGHSVTSSKMGAGASTTSTYSREKSSHSGNNQYNISNTIKSQAKLANNGNSRNAHVGINGP